MRKMFLFILSCVLIFGGCASTKQYACSSGNCGSALPSSMYEKMEKQLADMPHNKLSMNLSHSAE